MTNLSIIKRRDAEAQRGLIIGFSKFKWYYLLLVLPIFACQNQEAAIPESPKETVTTSATTPNAVPPPLPSLSIADGIQQDQPLTAYIKKKMGDQLWHFETVRIINQPEKSKAYQGKWIKFNPDNTLLSGHYDEAGLTGKWVYDEAKDLLTIMEGGERPSFSQWKIQFSSNTDDLSIWVGTSRFQNNNTQMKMLRRAEKPKKS